MTQEQTQDPGVVEWDRDAVYAELAHNESAEWLRRQGKQVSGFGAVVAHIVGIWNHGIYHADRAVLKADWHNETFVRITVQDNHFSTFDFDGLTRLVILAHDFAVRVELSAAAHGYMWVMFHSRQRTGGIAERHPTIEEAVSCYSRPRVRRFGDGCGRWVMRGSAAATIQVRCGTEWQPETAEATGPVLCRRCAEKAQRNPGT